jgi:hypothetical protein
VALVREYESGRSGAALRAFEEAIR